MMTGNKFTDSRNILDQRPLSWHRVSFSVFAAVREAVLVPALRYGRDAYAYAYAYVPLLIIGTTQLSLH